jgi:hypothetical protein
MIFERIAAMRDASVSKQGEILVNYNDLICVNCILCAGTLENLNYT